MLGVGDRVQDHVLQKHFQDPAGLLIAQRCASPHHDDPGGEEQAYDALDVVAQNLAVVLSAAFPQAFAAFAASQHRFPRSKSTATKKLVVLSCP